MEDNFDLYIGYIDTWHKKSLRIPDSFSLDKFEARLGKWMLYIKNRIKLGEMSSEEMLKIRHHMPYILHKSPSTSYANYSIAKMLDLSFGHTGTDIEFDKISKRTSGLLQGMYIFTYEDLFKVFKVINEMTFNPDISGREFGIGYEFMDDPRNYKYVLDYLRRNLMVPRVVNHSNIWGNMLRLAGFELDSFSIYMFRRMIQVKGCFWMSKTHDDIDSINLSISDIAVSSLFNPGINREYLQNRIYQSTEWFNDDELIFEVCKYLGYNTDCACKIAGIPLNEVDKCEHRLNKRFTKIFAHGVFSGDTEHCGKYSSYNPNEFISLDGSNLEALSNHRRVEDTIKNVRDKASKILDPEIFNKLSNWMNNDTYSIMAKSYKTGANDAIDDDEYYDED